MIVQVFTALLNPLPKPPNRGRCRGILPSNRGEGALEGGAKRRWEEERPGVRVADEARRDAELRKEEQIRDRV